MRELPTGTVTFLFTDIEGSTRLLQELGDQYATVLAKHREALRGAFARHGGVEVDTQGDAFFVAFSRAKDALAAAKDAQAALGDGSVRIRIGVHTGEPLLAKEGYVGIDVHRAARIAAVGHGGQVLMSQSTRDLVGGDGLRDLGEHRLKDLTAPERIYQLGADEFPPLKTLYQTNLPVPATPFLGRQTELAEVVELLGRDDVRLVTVTGAGGTGKTRLALQAAAEVCDSYDHGVWWVPLAALSSSRLVLETVAQALGAKEDLVAHVGDKSLLLLLDNFEHVVAAAAELGELVVMCPRLRVLVTSRERLQVDGEWEYRLDPLRETEAVALFAQRARAVHQDVDVNGAAAEICRRLDCLPLAIELAAARAKVLPLPKILERLEHRLPLLTGGSRSAPERQRTLRATIEWSHDLLSPDEQGLFARLAVFSGGCTFDAAKEVCDADLDTLASLVDKSLVRRTGDRYWMLATIGEFATELFAASDEAEDLRRRHGDYFVALVERAEPELRAYRGSECFDRIEAEHANVRAVLDRALALGQGEAALRLCGAIWRFWFTRGFWAEGRRSLAAALSLADNVDPVRYVEPLWGATTMAVWQGDVEAGRATAVRLLELSRAAALQRGEGMALGALAIVATQDGDHARATTLYERSLDLARAVDDGWLQGVVTNNLGDLALIDGDYVRAVELFEESFEIGEARGDRDRRARARTNLGSAQLGLGEIRAARESYRAGLVAADEIGLREMIAGALLGLAACDAASDPLRAARLLGRAEALNDELGWHPFGFEERIRRHTAIGLRTSLGDELFHAARAEGAALSLDEAVALATID